MIRSYYAVTFYIQLIAKFIHICKVKFCIQFRNILAQKKNNDIVTNSFMNGTTFFFCCFIFILQNLTILVSFCSFFFLIKWKTKKNEFVILKNYVFIVVVAIIVDDDDGCSCIVVQNRVNEMCATARLIRPLKCIVLYEPFSHSLFMSGFRFNVVGTMFSLWFTYL